MNPRDDQRIQPVKSPEPHEDKAERGEEGAAAPEHEKDRKKRQSEADQEDERVDEAGQESFPASDPPAKY